MSAPFQQAEWIWIPNDPSPVDFYLYARREFVAPETIDSAAISITADSRYRLHVNGTVVGRGPARGAPGLQYFDTYDLAENLIPGERNVIGVLVHHFGVQGQNYVPAPGGLLAEANLRSGDGKITTVATDQTWRVIRAPEWIRVGARSSWATSWVECYDARRHLHGWAKPGYDDTAWQGAELLGKPPLEPWGQPVPRDIPKLAERHKEPVELADSGYVVSAPRCFGVDVDSLTGSTRGDVVYMFGYVRAERECVVSINLSGGLMPFARHVWVNEALTSPEPTYQSGGIPASTMRADLRAGWNRVLFKVGRVIPAWSVQFSFGVDAGPLGRLEDAGISFYADRNDEASKDHINVSEVKQLRGDLPGRERFHTVTDLEAHMLEGQDGGVESLFPHRVRVTWETPMIPAVQMDLERHATAELSDIAPDGTGRAQYLVYDFGVTTTGFPRVVVEASAGTLVDIGQGEGVDGGRVELTKCKLATADRYICREGIQTFELFTYKSLRYLQLTFRAFERPVKTLSVGIVETMYPVEHRGAFLSSDAELNKIWSVSQRTLEVCMHDGYEDTPWREQGQWLGDALVEIAANYALFGDTALAERLFRQFAHGQRADGNLPIIYPAKLDLLPNGIPTFTPQWIIALYNHYLYTGEQEFLAELYPTLERVIGFFEAYLDEHGLLNAVPGCTLLDWLPEPDLAPHFGGSTIGEHTGLNCLYYAGLSRAVAIARALGKMTDADRWEAESVRLKTAVNKRLFDQLAGIFVHERVGDEVTPRFSVHETALAVYSGVCDGPSAAVAMKRVLYDTAIRAVQPGSPYFHYFLLEALRAAGLHDDAVAIVRRDYGMMIKAGATTWWETLSGRDASRSHGWGAAPAWDFATYILGVKNVVPGFHKVSIEPRLGCLSWVNGRVPTPRGAVGCRWLREEQDLYGTVTIPFAAEVELVLPAYTVDQTWCAIDGRAVDPVIRDEKVVFQAKAPGVIDLARRRQTR